MSTTKVSKNLSWLLRHGAEESGIPLTEDGYAHWSDISKLKLFKGTSLETIVKVVESCKKQRFKLVTDEATGAVRIRANQGHTMTTVDAAKLLTPLTMADLHTYPYVVHGTTAQAWPLIKKAGLNKMARNHIHFALGLPKDKGVISGMRGSSAVLIELDLPAVLAAGNIPMFISDNKVILSPGLDGAGSIPPQYFKSVTSRKDGADLLGTASASAGGGGGAAASPPRGAPSPSPSPASPNADAAAAAAELTQKAEEDLAAAAALLESCPFASEADRVEFVAVTAQPPAAGSGGKPTPEQVKAMGQRGTRKEHLLKAVGAEVRAVLTEVLRLQKSAKKQAAKAAKAIAKARATPQEKSPKPQKPKSKAAAALSALSAAGSAGAGHGTAATSGHAQKKSKRSHPAEPKTPPPSSPFWTATLDELPAGSAVAVVRLVGSLCPVTEAHIDCFKQARSILLGKAADATCTQFVSAAQTPFVACIGLLSLNGERYVDKKLKEKGQRTISYSERHHLISLATADIPWLGPTATHAKWNDAAGDFEKLQSHYPALNFTCYTMNGADDVVAHAKWRPKYCNDASRLITMGREGSMEDLYAGMASVSIPRNGNQNFVVGPVIQDISSTKARQASARGDRATLITMLHPHVADWMLAREGYATAGGGGGGAAAAGGSVAGAADVGSALTPPWVGLTPADLIPIWEAASRGKPDKKQGVVAFYGHDPATTSTPFYSNFYWHDAPFEFIFPECVRPTSGVLAKTMPASAMVHCSEMAIMMCKAALMNDSDSFEAMLAERYPQQAKKLGRCVYPFIEERWQSNILEIAVEVVYQKFTKASGGLKEHLLATGTKVIAECTKRDKIWGTGVDTDDRRAFQPGNWRGTNVLGWALMQARQMIRRDEEAAAGM